MKVLLSSWRQIRKRLRYIIDLHGVNSEVYVWLQVANFEEGIAGIGIGHSTTVAVREAVLI